MVFLELRWEIGVPLEVRWGPQGTSCIDTVESGLLSCCKGHFRIPLESLQGNRASSVIGGKSRDVFLVMGGSFRFLSSCDEDLRNFSCCLRKVRPPLKL